MDTLDSIMCIPCLPRPVQLCGQRSCCWAAVVIRHYHLRLDPWPKFCAHSLSLYLLLAQHVWPVRLWSVLPFPSSSSPLLLGASLSSLCNTSQIRCHIRPPALLYKQWHCSNSVTPRYGYASSCMFSMPFVPCWGVITSRLIDCLWSYLLVEQHLNVYDHRCISLYYIAGSGVCVHSWGELCHDGADCGGDCHLQDHCAAGKCIW